MQIEAEKLHTILKSFFILTGVRIAVFNNWRHEIAAYPQSICPLCQTMRKNEQFDRLCRKSDGDAFDIAQSTRKQYTYQCHAGLCESISPIIQKGHIVGYLMIGQFIRKADKTNFTRNAAKNYAEIPLLGNEYDTLKALTAEHAEAIAAIMAICTEYLCFSNTVAAQISSPAKKAERFIEDHLSEPLTVQRLADALGMSRTSTYTLIKNNFGKSIIEYVNYKKIEAAKKMLADQRPTQEILDRLNISSANYFYRLFKQQTGLSLAEYKRNLN